MDGTTDLLSKVRRIEIKTRRLSSHLFSGEYHSSFKGRGMAFSEVRQYQYGDDIRSIDWNVTARKREPYIKVFEEERELTMLLLVDVSASEAFGTDTRQKRTMITEICATLAFSALQNNDKVGVIFFSDRIEKVITPRKGKTHVLRIIRELIDFQPEGKGTDLNGALEYVSKVIKKKSILFVLSDFDAKNYDHAMRIAAKKHDLTGIRIVDRAEVELPKLGLVPMLDPETNTIQWVDTSDSKVRSAHAKNAHEIASRFDKVLLRSGAGRLSLQTHEDWAIKLLNYFKQRAS